MVVSENYRQRYDEWQKKQHLLINAAEDCFGHTTLILRLVL
jgi:hypothetical protein